jgi:hypothetical protein
MTEITKVWFTGAHGTGKTTQMHFFHNLNPEYSELTLEVRDLVELGIIKINKEAAPWDELAMKGRAILNILSASAPFVCDRSWIDKCAYAQALPFPDELLEAYHIENTYAFPGMENNEIYFYFPPILDIEDDGVRSTNKDYQKEIDLLVQFYLNYFQIPFITLESSSVQDRHFEIQRAVFGKIK